MKFPFQTILIGICVLAFVGAILVFSGIIPVSSKSSNQNIQGQVLIWGVIPASFIEPYINQLTIDNPDISISYQEKDKTSFASELVSALADNQQPDIVIATQEELFTLSNKLYTITYDLYPERSFRDTFIDGATLFLGTDGIKGIPLLVDPLVVYYNKDILAGARYINPPVFWETLVQSIPRFLKKDSRGAIVQTALPFGDTGNINDFKSILGTLFLQTGNPIVLFDSITNKFESRLSQGGEASEEIPPIAQALTFYTNFSNPTSSLYSWSGNLPPSLSMFLSARSAFYIGRASELFSIQEQNPNLSFDVMGMFQPNDSVRPVTQGNFITASIVEKTPNFPAAYSVFTSLTTKEFTDYLSKASSIPPARRDLLGVPQPNPYVQVFFQSAINTFSWPDKNPVETTAIFRDTIQAVKSGRLDPIEAIYEASRDLQSALR